MRPNTLRPIAMMRINKPNARLSTHDSKGDNGLGVYLGIGIAIGAGVGVSIGTALGNIGVGIAIGVGVGVALGVTFAAAKQ